MPSIIPSAARDEQIAPPPFRLPVIDQVAREKSWRDERIAPGARNTGRAVDEKKQWGHCSALNYTPNEIA
jgi:hypothetical protein